jgi:hypothetical protein
LHLNPGLLLILLLQGVLDSYKEQLVGDAIIHTHLTALYGEQRGSYES